MAKMVYGVFICENCDKKFKDQSSNINKQQPLNDINPIFGDIINSHFPMVANL
jgi:hypothetical protein